MPNKNYAQLLKTDFNIDVPVAMPMYICDDLYHRCIEDGSDDPTILAEIASFNALMPWANTTNAQIENTPAFLRKLVKGKK